MEYNFIFTSEMNKVHLEEMEMTISAQKSSLNIQKSKRELNGYTE